VSISRWAPRNAPAGYKDYSKLAPGPWFNKVNAPEFCGFYGAQLMALDPQRTFDELVILAGRHEPVLMCWDVPPFVVPAISSPTGSRQWSASRFLSSISRPRKLGRGIVRNVPRAAPDHVVPTRTFKKGRSDGKGTQVADCAAPETTVEQ